MYTGPWIIEMIGTNETERKVIPILENASCKGRIKILCWTWDENVYLRYNSENSSCNYFSHWHDLPLRKQFTIDLSSYLLQSEEATTISPFHRCRTWSLSHRAELLGGRSGALFFCFCFFLTIVLCTWENLVTSSSTL